MTVDVFTKTLWFTILSSIDYNTDMVDVVMLLEIKTHNYDI